jgi:hypothetical protein
MLGKVDRADRVTGHAAGSQVAELLVPTVGGRTDKAGSAVPVVRVAVRTQTDRQTDRPAITAHGAQIPH